MLDYCSSLRNLDYLRHAFERACGSCPQQRFAARRVPPQMAAQIVEMLGQRVLHSSEQPTPAEVRSPSPS